MTGPSLRAAFIELQIGAYVFAQMVQCEPSTVYKWLRGDISVPGYVERIIKLMRENRALHKTLREAVSDH